VHGANRLASNSLTEGVVAGTRVGRDLAWELPEDVTWAEADPDSRWLTCPIVQSGVLRVASQPRDTNSLDTVSAVRDLVRAFTAHPGHEFLADDVTLLDDRIVRPERLTPASTTDVYLLLLAQQHGAKLATFDRRLPVDAIDGGTEAIEVIGV